ncbi:MAG: ribonuclease HII [Clostridia bacterium]|nr:ribonuclease HII [Clostridia bacterium]
MAFPGTVKELQEIVNSKTMVDDDLLEVLAADQRVGIQKLYRQLLNRKKAAQAEKERLAKLFTHERRLGSPEIMIAGVDEAGRGPLAGPVTAAAVILDPQILLPGLDDSKKKSPKERELLAGLIQEKSLAFSIGWATVEEIDCLNILQASFLAMKRAISGLSVKPDHVLVDGWEIKGLGIPQTAVVKGDRVSASIAAASIVAKVARDQLMEEMAELYPQYGFHQHKGYPTKEHYAALAKYGPSPLHRRSFKGVETAMKTLPFP